MVLALLLGWLPGPLGIPLFLAGLSLLAINHEWARRWLKYGKNQGSKIMDMIFASNIWIQRLIDLVGLSAIGAGIWWLFNFDSIQRQFIAVMWTLIGTILVLVNRNRFKSLVVRVKQKRKN